MNVKFEKKEVNKVNKTIQQWYPIKNIEDDGIIILKNKKIIKIIKVYPINYNLKSNLEKEAILTAYKNFLKTINFNIQILIQSNKEDLSQHITNIQKNSNKNTKKLTDNYIQFINDINNKRKSSSKNFFIIISTEILNKKEKNLEKEIIKNNLKEKYFKIKDNLTRCGNIVEEINEKEEINKIIYSFINPKEKIKKIEKEMEIKNL